MLPQRQKSGKKPHAAHSQRVTVRKALFGALGVVFLVIFYFNFRFFSSSDARAGGKLAAAASAYEKKAALESKLLHDHRQPKQVVFTSGCSNLDLIHGEVLAYTVRSTGFDRNVTHLMYGCTDAAFRALVAKKNPVYNVKSYAFPAIKEAKYMFGEGQLTTTVHPQVLQQWITQQLAAPGGGELKLVKDNEFIMIVDSDAIFTKKVDVRSLFREVEDITDPKWFGQDASWFCPKRTPLDDSALKKVVPSSFPTLEPKDWRPFAATAPFVLEFGVLKKILPSAVEFWSKLEARKRHLAFPLAAAHNAVPIGISGVLSVHHYPSRYENWDFVDDIKHNPCNESATLRRIALPSYPITIRAQNFTLPPWIDGRDWNFFDSQIPVDILSCDAWLFKEPSGYLWHLASNTNGYERVPTILRRRHTMSVCLALHSYNSAITDYKSHFCPFGYNANKKVPMELGKEAWATAVALAPQTAAEIEPVVHFGDYKKKKTSDTEAAPKPGQANSDDVHFVFSTTCEPYQDWQSQVLAHSFATVQQRGRLTRIVSGCSDADLQKAVELARVTPFMHLHITKDFSDRPSPEMKVQDDYAPYNKPFGIRDWLRTANPPMKESLVVIIDPDFMFLKPFVLNSDFRITKGRDVDSQNYQEHTEVIEGLRQYKPFFVYEGKRDLATVNDHVSNGVAIAQRWSSYLGAAGFEDPKGTNFQLCPDCKKTTKEDGLEYFSVGPPYAMTRHDLDLFIDDYCNMTVGKRELHRDSWMAEMMGYVLAASRHDVKHTTFDNLALAGKEDEYWSFIDFIKGNPCADPVKPMVIAEVAPLLHGCHTYKGTDDKGHEWIYYKQYMPNDLFACDSWMLAVPPASVWTVAKSSGDKKKMQHAYGLCTSVKVVNQAIFDFKQKVCVDGFNQNKKLRLVDPRAATELKVGQVHEKWVSAADEVAPTISTSAP